MSKITIYNFDSIEIPVHLLSNETVLRLGFFQQSFHGLCYKHFVGSDSLRVVRSLRKSLNSGIKTIIE